MFAAKTLFMMILLWKSGAKYRGFFDSHQIQIARATEAAPPTVRVAMMTAEFHA
jgi:hypothetical protein